MLAVCLVNSIRFFPLTLLLPQISIFKRVNPSKCLSPSHETDVVKMFKYASYLHDWTLLTTSSPNHLFQFILRCYSLLIFVSASFISSLLMFGQFHISSIMSLSNLLRCLPVIASLFWMHRFYSWMRLAMHWTVPSSIFWLSLLFLIIIVFKCGFLVIMWSTCLLSNLSPISDNVIRALC
jgi:hypothetical protein